MDEEKAAAYYDELRRKGGGAAKLKQGLGYCSPPSLAPQASAHSSFPSFVKGDDHADRLSKYEKESRLSLVRDKLKRRPVEDSDRDAHCPGSHSRDREQTSKKGHGNGLRAHTSRSQDKEHRSRSHWRRQSHSNSSRSRSRSSSSSGDPNHRENGKHSPEKSIDRTEQRKRESIRMARKRSRSPRPSSRRSQSVSPRREWSSYKHGHRHRGRVRRSPSPYLERQKRKSVNEDARIARKAHGCEYSKLIPGYDDMTPAEKVKEKMRFQLSQTVSKDTARGMDTEWERFTFNKNAPLDDDAKLDYFGDGTGADDDTVFLQNTGSTFLSTGSQAKREAQIQAAHDAAIFGPSKGLSSKNTVFYGQEVDVCPTKEATSDDGTEIQSEASPTISSLLSDQVLTLQQGSWRERALKLKQQRAADTIT